MSIKCSGLELDIKFYASNEFVYKPVITAGGINPDNVCDFIKDIQNLDVMTGVENLTWRKDKEMLSRLLSLVHAI